MPAYKGQHYVPRCHLRPFSQNQAGRAVHLLNLSRLRPIANASIRGQCAKDYFYEKDFRLEAALRVIEEKYSAAVRSIQFASRSVNYDDLLFLRDFIYLQFGRTDMAVRRNRFMMSSLWQAVYRDEEHGNDTLGLSDHALVRMALELCAETSEYIEDLKICIVRNQTDDPFVTSDDPAIFMNRLYLQRFRQPSFGLRSSGAMLLMPLTPHHLIMCSDGNVYTVPDKTGYCVNIRKHGDILALNELLYLKAANNLYFSDWTQRVRIIEEFQNIRNNRPASWSCTSVLVPDGYAEGGERFRRATEEERKTARRIFVAQSSRFPAPSRWLSKLRFRSNPITYSNNTSAGYVRKREWLRETI